MDEQKMIAVVNQQKGEFLALNDFVLSMFRAMPMEMQAVAFQRFDSDTEKHQGHFLKSDLPDDVLKGYAQWCAAFARMRRPPPA